MLFTIKTLLACGRLQFADNAFSGLGVRGPYRDAGGGSAAARRSGVANWAAATTSIRANPTMSLSQSGLTRQNAAAIKMSRSQNVVARKKYP